LGSCGADCPEPQSACPFLICYVVTRTESTKKYCSGIRVMLRDDACSVPQPDALRQWRKRILANAKAYDHTIWVHMYNFWSFLKCGSKIFNLVNYKDINYILLYLSSYFPRVRSELIFKYKTGRLRTLTPW
jgi:hypothetical protein